MAGWWRAGTTAGGAMGDPKSLWWWLASPIAVDPPHPPFRLGVAYLVVPRDDYPHGVLFAGADSLIGDDAVYLGDDDAKRFLTFEGLGAVASHIPAYAFGRDPPGVPGFKATSLRWDRRP